MIGPAQRARIAELRAFAAANVLEAGGIVAAAGRDMAAYRDAMQMHATTLPMGFVVCFSHERQPHAPPPGVCAHLSVSMGAPDLLPGPSAVQEIMTAFGMGRLEEAAGVWVEDVSPSKRAVNVLELLSATAAE